jgi:hypothetical protein
VIKKVFVMFGLSCFMLSGCQISAGTSLKSSTLTPTGYASEEVQRISVFYDGSLYLYNATGFDLPKEDDWELLGQVVSVNDLEWPSVDFVGTHLNIGQEIYWKPSEPQKLYVKYDNGFALFEAEETKKEKRTEYLDHVTAGIKLWTSDSLELKLTNVSNETISYGESFTMEVLHDGIWEKLPVLSEEYGFNDILYELKPGEYRFIDIDFAWLYGELREGWFRIIKEIYLQDGTVYSVPAEFGALDFRQTESVNSKDFGNPKEVLDEMSITSNVIVTKSNEDELEIKFELENVGVCTFVASKGTNLSLPNETFVDATKIKWTAQTADDEYIFPYMKVNEAGDMFMIDWTYKECYFAIYGKSPEKTADRDMAGKIALEMIRNLGADTTNIKIDYGASSIYTKAEMDEAIELIKKEFNTWDGCELHSISYSTDDACSESNIAWMNEMEKATDAEETFTQCIMFKSDFHSPLHGGSGFNPDEEYTDWQWWLARSEGGQWKLMTYGY